MSGPLVARRSPRLSPGPPCKLHFIRRYRLTVPSSRLSTGSLSGLFSSWRAKDLRTNARDFTSYAHYLFLE